MRGFDRLAVLVTGSLLMIGMEALAVEKVTYDNVVLNAEVYETVPRDELRVMVSVFAKGRDRRKIADEVAKKTNKVFETAKKRPEVSTELASRGARREYGQEGERESWIDEAEILLKGVNFAEVHKLVSEVQPWAAISNMEYVVSEETRNRVEDELIKKGVLAFREKADFLAKELGGSGWDMVDVRLDGQGWPMRYGGAKMAAMNTMYMDQGESVAMEVDAGEDKIALTVNGAIRIRR